MTFGPISVSGTQVTMESPKLTGFQERHPPLRGDRERGDQDVRGPNLVELKDLKARIVTDEQGGAARLEAASGVLDTQKERMELRQSVRVRTDTGQRGQAPLGLIDFKAGIVVSDEPVTVSLANGVIEAEGLEVTETARSCTSGAASARCSSMLGTAARSQPASSTGSSRQRRRAPTASLRP